MVHLSMFSWKYVDMILYEIKFMDSWVAGLLGVPQISLLSISNLVLDALMFSGAHGCPE